jgi:hypothetical protein
VAVAIASPKLQIAVFNLSLPPLPLSGHKFSGDINGLNRVSTPAKGPFRLASIARFLYPMVCLACERPQAVI